MGARSTDRKPPAAVLRAFGLVMAGAVGLFLGLLVPWVWGLAWPLWPWAVAAVLVVLALAAPAALGPLHRLWMTVGQGLGWLNTRLLLGAVFFLVLVPMGLAMRAFRDPLARRLEPERESYRQPSRQPRTENLERPF